MNHSPESRRISGSQRNKRVLKDVLKNLELIKSGTFLSPLVHEFLIYRCVGAFDAFISFEYQEGKKENIAEIREHSGG